MRGAERATDHSHQSQTVDQTEPTEPLEYLAARLQGLAARPRITHRDRVVLGDHGGDRRASIVPEPEQAMGSPDRDVGEPSPVALAQPLQLVEVARIGAQISKQAVSLLSAGERLAPPRARCQGRRAGAELALESQRAREVRDRRLGIGGRDREPARA